MAASALQYSLTDLGTLPGGTFSFATDINSSGQVVGYADDENGETRAFVYDGGIRSLGTLGGPVSVANSILDDGQIFGYSAIDTGQLHSFGYDGEMHSLGLIRGTLGQSFESHLSASLGGTADANGFHLAQVNDGTVRDLGTLGGRFSYALEMGLFGDVVGYAETADFTQHAFLYRDDVMLALNDLVSPNTGWVLRSAAALNDSGQIVGYGTVDGETRGFLLTPAVQAVPEAGTGAAVMAVAVGAAGGWLRRRSAQARTKAQVPRPGAGG